MGQIPFWAGVEFDALKTAFKAPASQRAAAIMAAAKALDHVVTVGTLEIPKGGDSLVRELLAAQRQTLNVSSPKLGPEHRILTSVSGNGGS